MGAKPIKSELGGVEHSESSDSDEGGPSVLIEDDKTYLSPRDRTRRLTVNDFELLNVVGKCTPVCRGKEDVLIPWTIVRHVPPIFSLELSN